MAQKALELIREGASAPFSLYFRKNYTFYNEETHINIMEVFIMKIVKKRIYIGDVYPCTCTSCGADVEVEPCEFSWTGHLMTMSWACSECKHINIESVPKLMKRKMPRYDVKY